MTNLVHKLSFLNHKNYRLYSIQVAKYLGSVNAAILLSELIERLEYHTDNNELYMDEKHGGDWFFYTQEKCEERTALTRKEQESALKKLEQFGFIEKKVFGLPAKRYFRLKERILEVFEYKEKSTSLPKTDKLDCTKGTNWNDQKGQTAHIYKNHTYEPHVTTTTTEEVVVVPSSKEETNKNLEKIHSYLEDKAEKLHEKWRIPKRILSGLLSKYGINYLCAQLNYITRIEEQAIKDEKLPTKKRKTSRIDNPEKYLRIACKENYAMYKEE